MSEFRRRLMMTKSGSSNIPNYLCFTALESGTFTLTIGSSNTTAHIAYIEYSVDNGNTWVKTNNANSTTITITTPPVNAGDKVFWRGSGLRNSGFRNNADQYIGKFSSTCRFNVSGNVCSYLVPENFDGASVGLRAFVGLFKDCSTLIGASELILPTTFGNDCFAYMFQDCTRLITPPSLPMPNLTEYCYIRMFSGCTSLTTMPELPAITLAPYCYQYMFYGCTALTTALELQATTLANYCCQYMFTGCTSLTTSPILRAKTLVDSCYSRMFQNCSSLNNVTMLATDISASNCLSYWLLNVANSGVIYKDTNTNLPTGTSGVPNNWTTQDYQE